MMISKVYSASTVGVDARIIEVETYRSFGLPRYFLVGLPGRAVSESRDRIDAAIRTSNATFPVGRITVNLAPANLPKEGSAFDLPIAITLLHVSGQVNTNKLDNTLLVGELALDGKLRPVKGVLPMAMGARDKGLKYIVVPAENGPEAAVVGGIEVYAFGKLTEVMEWLEDRGAHAPVNVDLKGMFNRNGVGKIIDFCDVRGQETVKRALEVGAAGGHNLIMVGPPGSGKTMMARRLPSILPPLSIGEALETTKIHSVAGLLSGGQALVTRRPFRSPHHTVSDVALVGGGAIPKPGEISMAHNGVLFLDELPEFKRAALEVMRQPLEKGVVSIARTRVSVDYPSRIMLVASMNPSPTGDWYDPADPGGATPAQMQRYLSKVSGPLLDRIDLHIEVQKVHYEELSSKKKGEYSENIRKRVVGARRIQARRFREADGIYNNAQMSTRLTRQHCRLDKTGGQLLKRAMNSFGLSARAYNRILKVARTIADLDQTASIKANHIAEAIQYRNLDREGWLG